MKTDVKNWHLLHVPEVLRDPSATVKVLAASIEPKCASLLIRELNAVSPLPTLGHVKRVRRQLVEGGIELCIILCHAGSGDLDHETMNMPEGVAKLVKIYELRPFFSKVPQHEAATKEEWGAQNAVWPTSYHPNSSARLGTLDISDEEHQKMCMCMKLAINEAHRAQRYCQPANGAVLVDPFSNVVIAAAHDETKGKIDPEPSWNTCELPTATITRPCNGVDARCAISITSPNELSISGDGSCWHPLRHAVMVAIERAAERDRQLFPHDPIATENITAQGPGTDEGGVIIGQPTSKRQRTSSVDVECKNTCNENMLSISEEDLPKPYLCTGYDAYVTREPCSMCAMALVHQRVRRVIYGIPNVKFGALGSKYRLHGQQGLNHHYTVYQLELAEDEVTISQQKSGSFSSISANQAFQDPGHF